MKKTDLTLKQQRNESRNRVFASVLLASLILISTTSNLLAQTCKEKGKAKASTAQILFKVGNANNLDKLKIMVEEHGANINEQLENEETLLTLASWHGYDEMVHYLLDHGAAVNTKNKWNSTALANASMRGHTKIAGMLLDAGANIDEKFYSGNTCLNIALQHEKPETAILLVEKGADIKLANDQGVSPILMATWVGDLQIMESLVDKGADVNSTSSWGSTVLHNLARNEYPEVTAYILEKGGNPNTLDSEGRLPLHNAVINGNTETVKMLIRETNDINLREKMLGNTPLHITCINGDVKTASVLIAAQAKANLVNSKGKTPVYYAIKYGNIDVVKAMKDKKLATNEDLAMAEEAMKSGIGNVLDGQAKVTYTGHSGWIVQTRESVLVFDYWDKNLSSNACVANGALCGEEMKDKNVYVFVSHDHQDHFDTKIFEWAAQIENITYVYGFEPEKSQRYENTAYNGPSYKYVPDNQTSTIGNARITTHKSNDTGQGFLVEIDGITLYHPGDHALFTEEDRTFFAQEVDFIAENAGKVDLAFLPVTGCPSRWKKEYIVEGFFYSIDKLNPEKVFPMHAFNNEYTLKEFAEMVEEKDAQSEILCTEYLGDSFIYDRNLTAKK